MKPETSQPLTQLTAPSTWTEWVEVGRISPSSMAMLVTVAHIDTNVVFKVQYSENGTTVAAEGDPKTVTNAQGPSNNGNYEVDYSLVQAHRLARLYFVSESGGTGVTLDTKIVQFTN